MKLLSKFIAILWLAGLMSCTSDTSTINGTSSNSAPTDSTQATTDTLSAVAESSKPTCKLVGSVLEGNMFWAAGLDRLVVISAEEETADKDLGESHRVLTVYDEKCSQVFRELLPVNLSPDYPYYLSEITYNNVSKQVAIRGFDKFFILNLDSLKLSSALMPKFLNKRYVEDAQSGAIKRLELWENYLVGFAASMGPFAYDITDPNNPKPVLPIAEFTIVKNEQYNSLFLLKSTDAQDGYQALAPDFDYDQSILSLNILFNKPLKFDPVINKSFKNNRFILLKEQTSDNTSTPHAVDMKSLKNIELPADISAKKDTDILAWLKQQTK
ncbi:MAG: hypothetical protein K9J37_15875 [Saprospiraceae bacterium]|nr:hypothetical protein [Saprospiraceae bacterium]MCF8251391.1 hypothetical protein [Saprospiraceae bacterium]MCF8282642.1 hypothetical protein [Bacteroidales bacterium]MCF8312665.1 hypothetical protein [Saprospiraceae bacterium]MCF8441069.1 hypothetical protein [Saprospiraceae bacterium]